MGRKKKSRVGRQPSQRNPDAQRHQTTREGRAGESPAGNCKCCGLPTLMTVRKRVEAVGVADVGIGFPLDVLESWGWITREESRAGRRFAQLSWWLYGLPVTGPELLYERIASGYVDVDLAPRRELYVTIDDPEAAREELLRIERNKARYERAIEGLRKAAPRDLVLAAVKRATQYMEMPRLASLIGTADCRSADWREFPRLKMGLEILAQQSGAEDRHWSRERAAAIAELSRP